MDNLNMSLRSASYDHIPKQFIFMNQKYNQKFDTNKTRLKMIQTELKLKFYFNV